MNEDALDCLLRAMIARELGYDKSALEFLDAASKIIDGKIVDLDDIKVEPRRGIGRPPMTQDLDSRAIALMDAHSRRTSMTRPKTLARWVLNLKYPSFRRPMRELESEIRRLADKWTAKRDI